jgi:alanine dehydrogenase
MNKKTLILTNSQVQRLIDMPQVLKAVENAFILYGKKLVQMPAKIYLHLDKYAGDFRAMPAYIEGMEVCGLKWVNVHPENRRFGLNMVIKDKISDCIRQADIVVTTTPARKPTVESEWIRDGTHINAIGADAKGKEELEPELLKRAKIVVDD